MGLDSVEIVLRCEEVFGVALPDRECGEVVTVGDLYGLLCRHLGLEPVHEPDLYTGKNRLQPQSILKLRATPWNAEDVWATLMAVFVVQLQVNRWEVKWSSKIRDDLGCE